MKWICRFGTAIESMSLRWNAKFKIVTPTTIICQSNGTNGKLISSISYSLSLRSVDVSMKLHRADRIRGPPTETEIHLKVTSRVTTRVNLIISGGRCWLEYYDDADDDASVDLCGDRLGTRGNDQLIYGKITSRESYTTSTSIAIIWIAGFVWRTAESRCRRDLSRKLLFIQLAFRFLCRIDLLATRHHINSDKSTAHFLHSFRLIG